MVVVTVVLAAGIGRLGAAALAQQRAQAVADVAALAGATHGAAAVGAVTTANGARLVATSGGPDGTVRVLVSHRGARADAAASPG